ncbi:prepilin-type N-terminal cleavage/methylation domain-containing protein [Patescibacteria group bacterium]|nr:prepilin-type N-terminal cleavage/methylation domain-containing protein [Patescibacteria group bacterium]
MLKKNSAGFSLVELIVVMAIISLLSIVVFANYRTGEKQFALQRSAYKLAQDIRRVQNMAISAREFQGNVPPRYGLEFEKNRAYYFLFADINDNGRYEPSDVEVERITFEEGIKIQDLFTSASKTTVWVAFKPPDPLTTIQDPAPRSTLRIQLINVNGQTKIINVNKAGLIEIE